MIRRNKEWLVKINDCYRKDLREERSEISIAIQDCIWDMKIEIERNVGKISNAYWKHAEFIEIRRKKNTVPIRFWSYSSLG